MRHRILTALVTIALGAGTAGGGGRPSVAIYVTGDQVPPAELGEFTDRLLYELTRTGAFDIRRTFTSRQSQMFRELAKAGCSTVNCLVEAGRLLDVEAMVTGTVALTRDSAGAAVYMVRLRFVTVRTASVDREVSDECRCWWGQVLTGTIPRLAAQMARVEAQSGPAKQDSARPPSTVRPPVVAAAAAPKPDTVQRASIARALPDRQEVAVRPKPAQPAQPIPRPQPAPFPRPSPAPKPGRPPISNGTVVGQVALGGVGLVGGTVLGALAGAGVWVAIGENAGIIPAIAITGLGATLVPAAAVYSLGTSDEVTGSFGRAYFGSVVGLAGGIALAAATGGIGTPVAIFCPAIGATLMFNPTRRYRTPTATPPTALLSACEGHLTLGAPTVYYRISRADGTSLRMVNIVHVRF